MFSSIHKFIVLVLAMLCSISQAQPLVRNYDPSDLNDFNAIMAICSQHHEEFGECKACGGQFLSLLYQLSVNKQLRGWIKIIEDNQTIVGFCIYSQALRNATEIPARISQAYNNLQLAELSFIGIETSNQGKGYGKKLFQQVLKEVKNKGFSGIISRISKENRQAVAWHIQQGFEPVADNNNVIALELVYAQATNHVIYVLPLNKKILEDPILNILDARTKKSFYNTIHASAESSAQSGKLQCLMAQTAAEEKIVPTQELSNVKTVSRIIQRYLITTFDMHETEKLAAFLLGIKTLSPSIRKVLKSRLYEIQKAVLKMYGIADMNDMDLKISL